MENKICQNCKTSFKIDSEDLNFYQKMQVPPPTWCPACRLQRRFAFRNERALYKKKEMFGGEEVISSFSPDKDFKILKQKDWWGDGWDPFSFGREYDFTKPFFAQFKELMHAVPWPALVNWNAVNSEYCNYTTDNKNCYLVFGGDFNENCSYGYMNFYSKDSFDLLWVEKLELSYECVDTNKCFKVLFCQNTWDSTDSALLFDCVNCHHCFGCVGLKNKSYCILNWPYSKEEYLALVPKIIAHMDEMPYLSQIADGKSQIAYKYGEFFPPDLSPFAYNESIAQEHFPLSESEAKAKGFSWKVPEARNYTVTKKPEDLPDDIAEVSDEIVNDIIGCAHTSPPAGESALARRSSESEGGCLEQCTTAFKITPSELQFYKAVGVPLPRLCPNCRHYQRLKRRNPMKLWHRACQCAGKTSSQNLVVSSQQYTNTVPHFHGDAACPNEFETTYAPERPEIVYCENCYQQEVV